MATSCHGNAGSKIVIVPALEVNANLEPFRAKRAEIAAQPQKVWDILDDGASRARAIAQETMKEVREAVQLP